MASSLSGGQDVAASKDPLEDMRLWIDLRGRRVNIYQLAKMASKGRRRGHVAISVRRTMIRHHGDRYMISTIFVCSVESFGYGQPNPYETMTFKNGKDVRRWTYSTRREALKGHNKMLHQLRCSLKPAWGSHYKYKRRR